MKTRKLKTAVAIVLAGFLLSCIWIAGTPCPALYPSNAPAYIESVWPTSESETPLGCYVKRYLLPPPGIGVGVGIDTGSILGLEVPQSGNEDLPSFQNRVSLYVDGEEVPINHWQAGGGTPFIGGTEVDLAGWYFFSSNRFVLPGDHVAKAVIVTRSGKILEYEWQFRIK